MKSFFRAFAILILHLLSLACRREPALPPLSGRPVILCAGDSITADIYPRLLKEMLERDGLRVQVINAGVKGDNTAEYLRFLERSRVIERSEPKWVLLQLGTNDVRIDSHDTPLPRFRKNLEAILDRIGRQRNRDGSTPRILLATIPPIPKDVRWHFSAVSRGRVEAEINPTIRAIARERNLILADHHALFAARPELLPDVHPSPEGYRQLAAAWHRVLLPLLASAQKGGARP